METVNAVSPITSAVNLSFPVSGADIILNTILTKKLASMLYYRFDTEWNVFIEKFEKDMSTALFSIIDNSES